MILARGHPCGFMNMQISPTTTHSHYLRDPLAHDHTLTANHLFETVFGSLQF